MTPLIGRTTLNPPLPHPTHIHGPPIDSGEISSRRDDWMLSHERQAWARAIEEARGGRGWGGEWEDEEEEKEKRGSCVHFYPKKGKTERKRKKRRKIILRKIITPRQKIRPKRGGAGEGRIEKEEEKEEGE